MYGKPDIYGSQRRDVFDEIGDRVAREQYGLLFLLPALAAGAAGAAFMDPKKRKQIGRFVSGEDEESKKKGKKGKKSHVPASKDPALGRKTPTRTPSASAMTRPGTSTDSSTSTTSQPDDDADSYDSDLDELESDIDSEFGALITMAAEQAVEELRRRRIW